MGPQENRSVGSVRRWGGGGIAGIQASLDLANAGIKVYLLESRPAIGGRMAQLDKTFPTNDCAMCIVSPKLVETGRHLNIEILTDSELLSLAGDPGRFTARVRRRPRYVDTAKCTGCADCVAVCPIGLPNEFNAGLDDRKAIYRPYPQAVPNSFLVTKRGTSPCKAACPAETSAQGYVALIREGRYEEALEVVREYNPFPASVGRVCTHPCETACSRGKVDSPVAICALKRFAADWVYEHGASSAKAAGAGDGITDRPAARDRRRGIGACGTELRPPPGADGVRGHGIRIAARRGGDDAGRDPRVPPAPGGAAAGDRRDRRRGRGDPARTPLFGRSDKLFAEGYAAVFLAIGAHEAAAAGYRGGGRPGGVSRG